MKSIDRVMNTLQGQSVDRTPVSAVLSAYGARLAGLSAREVFGSAASYLKAHKAVHDTFAVDLALAPFDYSIIAEGFGGGVKFFDDQPPNLKRPAADSWRELIEIPYPDFTSTGRFPVMLEALKLLAEHFAGEKPVFVGIPGPCSLPILILGLDTWMDTLLFDPEGAQKVFEYSGRFFLSWAEKLMENGANGLIVTEGMAAAEITNRAFFIKLILPHFRDMISRVSAPMVFHHTGGSVNHILDLIKGIAGLVGFCVSSEDDLLEARKILGGQPLLLGNIDNLRFPRAGHEKIYRQSLDILDKMFDQGPFILSNSGGDLPLDTPEENINAMIRASEDFKGN